MLFSISCVFGQNGDLKVEIERIILHDTEISLDDTPGFIIGIVDQDSTYYVEFGSDIKGEKSTLDAEDIFEVGSISKVFTSSLVSILVENGILNYEDKINSFLPEGIQNPRMDDVTLLHLIQHTSGLPVRPYFFGAKEKDPQNPYGYYEKSELSAFYVNFVPKTIGEFNYAHTNYGLLEIVLEYATQTSFDKLMDQYIFDPIEMDSSFVFFKERKKDIVTVGYDRAGRETKPWTFASFGASEGVKTTASDLVKFMKINIGLTDHPYVDKFKTNHLKEVETDFNESIRTGKGWQIIDQRRGYDIITHSGKTNGHNAFIAFIKETGTGVIVLSNSNIGTRDLGFLVLRMINFNWKRKA
ncbi:MAG: serine hydrolase [Saprospiraceae bacterium]|nr:serine hydrolase [Saprospiraceae bacterium]